MRIGIEQWGYREDGDQANEGAVRTGVRQNKVAVKFRNYADEGAVTTGIRQDTVKVRDQAGGCYEDRDQARQVCCKG